jgi:hypothetical protein
MTATAYRLVERDLHTDQHLTVWDAIDGHPLTASQASDLLIRVRAARPYLREPHCTSYLEVEPVPADFNTWLAEANAAAEDYVAARVDPGEELLKLKRRAAGGAS